MTPLLLFDNVTFIYAFDVSLTYLNYFYCNMPGSAYILVTDSCSAE